MQFAYLIHRREWNESRIADILRFRGHQVDLVCHRDGDPLPAPDGIDGVVVGGGDVSVWQRNEHPFMARQIEWVRQVVDAGMPYLGICLGSQILGAAYGSQAAPRADGRAEFGFYPLAPTTAAGDLFEDLTHVYQVHYEATVTLPPDAVHLARSDDFEIQAFRIGECAYGLQFHPDARADMVDKWWRDNRHLHDRPGIQSLDEQRGHAQRYERSRSTWAECFVDHWLQAAAVAA